MSEAEDGLRLYNTMTRAKELFRPIDAAHIRVYVCGPTVYDFAHIGNARPVIVFDLLYRLLRHLAARDAWHTQGATRVTYVRNITDVDDKINARAARDYPDRPLNEAIDLVTRETARQFHEDVAALGCLAPDVEPRATMHVGDMIELIIRLLDKGHAYIAADHVLFDVGSWTDADGSNLYGSLSGRSLEDMIAGARVEVAPYKRDAMDFVLWKPSRAEEPGWDSPWGRGRPGWHIECSAMADRWLWQEVKHSLGEGGRSHPHEFDIHGGGIDLVFPHHENELAQSCCAHDTRAMARIWMHNGFLQLEGRKMAKSEGNFVTIRDLLDTPAFGGRSWPGAVLRLAMLMTHYREPIDFSLRKLEEAKSVLERWADALEMVAPAPAQPVGERGIEAEAGALLDDLNTPAFIQGLHLLARRAQAGEQQAGLWLRQGLDLIGLSGVEAFSARAAARDRDEAAKAEIAHAIERRLDLIRDKNWAEADRIRDELLARGIQLMDGKDPTTGERTTRWEVKR